MSKDDMRELPRREFSILAAGAVTGASVGIAGCVGGDDTDDTDDTDDNTSADGDNTDDTDDVNYPEEGNSIQSIVPYDPGGSVDFYSRSSAPYISEQLPNQVDIVTENLAGGGGIRGSNSTWTADPDGYTYGWVAVSTGVFNQIARSDDVEYDMMDFTWVAQMNVDNVVVTKQPDLDPIENIEELAEVYQTENVALAGGSIETFTMAMGEISGMWEIDEVSTVRYEGAGEATAGMERGEVQITLNTAGGATAGVEEGILDPVVTLTTEPIGGVYEGVPPITDFGLDDETAEQLASSMQVPFAMKLPPETPQEKADILEEAALGAFENEELIEEARDSGFDVQPLSADELASDVELMYETWLEQEDLLIDILG